jgi:hypothetical protein
MPPNLKLVKRTLKSFAELGLLPRGEPRQGHDNDNRVARHGGQSPRVRGGRGDDREVDRADDRDQEDRSDREDDE